MAMANSNKCGTGTEATLTGRDVTNAPTTKIVKSSASNSDTIHLEIETLSTNVDDRILMIGGEAAINDKIDIRGTRVLYSTPSTQLKVNGVKFQDYIYRLNERIFANGLAIQQITMTFPDNATGRAQAGRNIIVYETPFGDQQAVEKTYPVTLKDANQLEVGLLPKPMVLDDQNGVGIRLINTGAPFKFTLNIKLAGFEVVEYAK